MTIVIDALGKARESGAWIAISCNRQPCHHNARIDLDYLCSTFGENHSCLASAILTHYRCSRCGSKDLMMTVGQESEPPQFYRGHQQSFVKKPQSSHRRRGRH